MNLDADIRAIKDFEDVRIILRLMMAQLDTLEAQHGKIIGDLVIRNPKKGLVLRGVSGHYYRGTLSGTSTITISWEDLGVTEPKE